MKPLRALSSLALIVSLCISAVSMLAHTGAHAAGKAPEITLPINAVVAGEASSLAVQGTAFTPNSQATLRYGGAVVGTATINADGVISATATLPASAVPLGAIGRHLLEATDGAGLHATAPLTVVGLSISTPMAPVGAQVTIGGKGFLSNQPLTVRLGDKIIVSTRTDRSGRFADHTFIIPAGLTGQLPLELHSGTTRPTRGISELTARITFDVTQATLTLDHPEVRAGDAVSIHGDGFAAHAKLRLTLGSVSLGVVRSDAAGVFDTSSVVIPATVTAGPHTIGITDAGKHTLATVVLTIQGAGSAAVATTPVTATATHTPVPGNTHTATHTPVPTATHTVTPTATRTATQTVMPTATHTPLSTATHTPLPTATHTTVPTATATHTATHTAVPTATATHTAIPTATATPLPAALAANPASVVVGHAVTVSGSHYLPGEQIDVQLVTAAGNGSLHLIYVTANGAGAFQLNNLVIPITTPSGAYQIAAIGLHSARTARVTIQVTAPQATLNVQPIAFSPQDTIQVSGANYLPGEPISIVLSTRLGTASLVLGQLTANGAGSFGPVTLHVPFGVPAGELQVVADGQRSNRQAIVPVNVKTQTPTLTSSAGNVKPTDKVTLAGSHFQPGETVTVDLVALSFSTRLSTVIVSSAGAFTLPKVTIPANTPQGTASLLATGVTSRLSAAVQIAVGALPATLSLSSADVTAGSTLRLTAKGFIPGETIAVELVSSRPELTLASAVVDTIGSASIAKLTIPAFEPAGAYTLVVFGQTSGRSASAKLTIKAPPPAAPILSILAQGSSSPSRLSPGSLVQLAGSHFPGNTNLTLGLSAGGKIINLGVVSTSGNGAFGPVGLTVPANTPVSPYTLQALVGGKAIASIAVRVAPLTPTLNVAPGTVKPGAEITIRGGGFAPGEQVVLSLNGAALATSPATVIAHGGSFVATAKAPDTLNDGDNLLTAIGVSSRAARAVTLRGSLPVAGQWYLPNGDTTGNHRTILALTNPNGGAASVTLTFLYQNAPMRHTTLKVAAHSRSSVDLALVAGSGRIISTIVKADRPIGASSTISYGGGDTSTALGASAPATRWYLAEGFTGNSFRESLVIMNPNDGFATTDVRFLPFNGKPPREARFSVPAHGNIRIDVGRYMPGQSVSTIVTANQGVVVERSMQFGQGQRGAHDKVGATNASTVWMFAQADTGPNRQTFLTILNPSQAASAAVTATFFDAKGRPVGAKTVVVNALRRGNIKVNNILPKATISVLVTSNVPVVVERPQYEGPADLNAARSGSDVFGRNGGATSWLFPDANLGGESQDQVYVFNPGLQSARLRLTLYATNGATSYRDLTVTPNSRGSVSLNGIGGVPAGPIGVRLQSTNGEVVVAELFERNPARQTAGSTQGIAN